LCINGLDVLELARRGVVEGAAGACEVSDIRFMSESPIYLLMLEYAPAMTHKAT
jgi:hypothetical protein